MQATPIDTRPKSSKADDSAPDLSPNLSVAELDSRLEQAVQEHERSERLICDYLLEMRDRRGYEKFGFSDIYYYAEGRFGFSARKTRYLLSLGQQLQKLPQIKEALAQGRLGWTKASRIARVATTEDEALWLDSALSLSVRELDRKINEQRDTMGVRIRAWLTPDQAAVWENALEVCRRMTGEDLDVGRCLELIAGEFLATYAYLAYRKEEKEENACCEDASIAGQPEVENAPPDEEAAAVDSGVNMRDLASQVCQTPVCPDNDDLPSPTATVTYGKTWRYVLERDAYRCQYPDCGARSELHVHHIRFRSRSGKKGRARSNSPENLLTLCVFHHRMVHAGTIGVKGRAPSELEWRRPELMENATRRYDSGQVGFGGEVAREASPVYRVTFGKRLPNRKLRRKVTGPVSLVSRPESVSLTRPWEQGVPT